MSLDVLGLTAKILEAGIFYQGCWQGSKLRVAYSFAEGGPFPKGVGTMKRRQSIVDKCVGQDRDKH